MKVKLLSSLREKKRYIAFNLASEGKINRNDLAEAIENACKNFMGELNYGKAGLRVLKEKLNEKSGIIKVNNKYVDETKASVMLIKKINNQRVAFKNTKVSGVLNKVK